MHRGALGSFFRECVIVYKVAVHKLKEGVYGSSLQSLIVVDGMPDTFYLMLAVNAQVNTESTVSLSERLYMDNRGPTYRNTLLEPLSLR